MSYIFFRFSDNLELGRMLEKENDTAVIMWIVFSKYLDLSEILVYIRGLQCFKLNGNHTENDRYWQKNNFLLFAKCLKMYSLFRICILRIQKVL
jgi:hypothetical protein